MYVDNAAMQLVKNPKQFDVIVTGNIFGDILSDEASMLAGSIGMLPSASLDARQKGLYEPIHGSAPDIAGQDKANPLATILSLAMMFRYTFARADVADRIERAVRRVLQQGLRTGDIALPGRGGRRHARDGRRGRRRAGERVMAARRPKVTVRRASTDDAEAFCAMFAQPRAMAGTLQLPYPSAEHWRKRIADLSPDDFLLVAEVDGEVVGNCGLHAAGRGRRRHVASVGMSVHDDWQGRGVGTALLAAAIDIADNWLNYHRLASRGVHGQRRGDRAVPQVRLRDRGHAARGRVPRRPLRRRVHDGPAASRRPGVRRNRGRDERHRDDANGERRRRPQVHRKATKTARKRRSS